MTVTDVSIDSITHDHYPVNRDELREFYDDLREQARLSHDQAVETIGYAVDMDLAGCDRTGVFGKYLTHRAIMDSFPQGQDADLYENGANIVIRERGQS